MANIEKQFWKKHFKNLLMDKSDIEQTDLVVDEDGQQGEADRLPSTEEYIEIA